MPISQNSELIKPKPLTVLYGIPGVGKLTVAAELHKITGLPLFHNHLSKNLVDSVFNNTKPKGLLDSVRISFFEAASNENLGLIFTFVYAKKVDDEFMDQLVSISKSTQTPLYFIQLTCDVSVLKNRLEDESRIQYNKVRDFELLQETMKKYDLITPYSTDKNHLIINTSDLEPTETANQILHFINNPKVYAIPN